MKHISAIIVVTITSFCAIAQPKYAFRLSATFQNAKADALILAQYFGGDLIPIDTAYSQNGTFVFSTTEPVPIGMGRILGIGRGFDVVLDGTNISFEADASNVVGSIRFKGSPENEQFFWYQKNLRTRYTQAVEVAKKMGIPNEKDPRWVDRMLRFNAETKTITDSLFKTHPQMLATRFLVSFQEPKVPVLPLEKWSKKDSILAQNYVRDHFFDNTFLSDERMIYTTVVSVRLKKFLKEHIQPQAYASETSTVFDNVITKTKGTTELKKYVIGQLIQQYELTPNTAADSLHEYLSEHYILAEPTRWDASTVQKTKEILATKQRMAVGQVFPELSLLDVNNRPTSLSDINTEYTVVFFYEPGCRHCREKAPILRDFYALQDKNKLTICAISLDRNETTWKPFIEDLRTDTFLNVVEATGKIEYQKLGIYDYPTIYVLDKQKHILARYVDVKELSKYMPIATN